MILYSYSLYIVSPRGLAAFLQVTLNLLIDLFGMTTDNRILTSMKFGAQINLKFSLNGAMQFISVSSL